MKIEAMNLKPVQRAFYRIYVLPLHIPKREGEVKEAMQAELRKHKKFVKDQNLEALLEDYLAAQQNRQELYNEMCAKRAEFAGLKGSNKPVYKDLYALEVAVEEAEAVFKEANEAFRENWH